MPNTVVFVSSPTELEIFNITDLKNSKVFSFNIQAHKALEKNQIRHQIAEDYLSEEDKQTIFDLTVSYYKWYEGKDFSGDFEFDGINLLGLLDTAEFHQHLIQNLSDFLMIKRIIEKENPEKIMATTKFSSLLKPLAQRNKILVTTQEIKSTFSLPWDKIQIKFNVGGRPISFYLSRSTYTKIKNMIETIIHKIFGLWYVIDPTKKTILLLEFNSSVYKDLLTQLGKSDKNIVLINRRRPAIWNLDSFKTLLHSNCRIFNTNTMVDKTKKTEIESITSNYLQKLSALWSKDEMSNLFICEGYSFWYVIKDTLLKAYKDRFFGYVLFIHSIKKLFEKTNISCIVSLNVIGETEKIILAVNKNSAQSIMVEHGFANYTQELQRYDVLSNYPLLQDKIAVWGEVQKKYLVEYKNFEPKRIFVTGSPRHDIFFTREPIQQHNKQQNVLLTIIPITNITGHASTNAHIKFETFIHELCRILKKLNLTLVVKLHPGQAEHNEEIIDLFQSIDTTIPVYQINPILDLIESCDFMININPESCDTSTVIMEGLIMRKPVLTVFLDNKHHEIEFVKDNATISISDHSDLEWAINDILTDETRSRLRKNTEVHLSKYLSNQGTASQRFAALLGLL